MHIINLSHLLHHNPCGNAMQSPELAEWIRVNHLAPALRNYSKVFVNMDGFNRYTRTFLVVLFVHLLTKEKFTYPELEEKLLYGHSLLGSIAPFVKHQLNKEAIKKSNP